MKHVQNRITGSQLKLIVYANNHWGFDAFPTSHHLGSWMEPLALARPRGHFWATPKRSIGFSFRCLDFVYLPNLYVPTKSLGTPLRWRNILISLFFLTQIQVQMGETCQLWVSLQVCSSRVLHAGLGFVQICTFKHDWKNFTIQGFQSLEGNYFRIQNVFQ